MSLRRNSAILAVVLAAVVMSGCASASPLRFAAATATAGCTQEDYAAVVVRLSGAGEEAVTIEIAGNIEAPFRMTLSPLRRDVTRLNQPFARALFARAGESTWLTGDLRVQRLVRGQLVEGRYDFKAPDGHVLQGDFAAPWQAGGAACG